MNRCHTKTYDAYKKNKITYLLIYSNIKKKLSRKNFKNILNSYKWK